MKPRLINGRLDPAPASIEAAASRLAQLEHHVVGCQRDLDESPRFSLDVIKARFGSVKEYARWRDRAKVNLRLLRDEIEELRQWINIHRGDHAIIDRISVEDFWKD